MKFAVNNRFRLFISLNLRHRRPSENKLLPGEHVSSLTIRMKVRCSSPSGLKADFCSERSLDAEPRNRTEHLERIKSVKLICFFEKINISVEKLNELNQTFEEIISWQWSLFYCPAPRAPGGVSRGAFSLCWRVSSLPSLASFPHVLAGVRTRARGESEVPQRGAAAPFHRRSSLYCRAATFNLPRLIR